MPPPRRRCRRASPSFRLAAEGPIAAAPALNAAAAAAGQRRTASNRQMQCPLKAPAHLTGMVPMTMRRLINKAGATLLAVIATRMSMATIIDCLCLLRAATVNSCAHSCHCGLPTASYKRTAWPAPNLKCESAARVQIQPYGCGLAAPPYLLTDHEGHEMSTNTYTPVTDLATYQATVWRSAFTPVLLTAAGILHSKSSGRAWSRHPAVSSHHDARKCLTFHFATSDRPRVLTVCVQCALPPPSHAPALGARAASPPSGPTL